MQESFKKLGTKRRKSLNPIRPTIRATGYSYGPYPPPFPFLQSQYLVQWFWSLWTLKKYLAGKWLTTDANVKQAVTSCLQTFKSLGTMVGHMLLC